MKIMVTGAGGQLGYELAGVLCGETLFLAGRPEYDLTQDSMTSKIETLQPDLVIHAGAYTDVDGCERNPELALQTNAEGTRRVAEGAEKVRARLIYLSTDYVFNGRKNEAYLETDRPDPINVYGNSKLRGEGFVQQICSRYLIVRTSWVYGRMGRNFVKTILQRSDRQETLRVVDDQVGCPTYAKDLALAIARLTRKEKTGGIFHAAGTGFCTWFEFAGEILRVAGRNRRIVPMKSSSLDRPAKRPAFSALNCDKLAALGIRLRPWPEALADYLQGQTIRS